MDVSHIAAILYEEWDPIGVKGLAPKDEYQSYAERIVEMLDHGGDRGDVLEFLDRSRNQDMLLKSDREQDLAVIDAIEDYRRSLTTLVF